MSKEKQKIVKDNRKKEKIEKLYAQFGRLQVRREELAGALKQTVQQMGQIYEQVTKLEKEN